MCVCVCVCVWKSVGVYEQLYKSELSQNVYVENHTEVDKKVFTQGRTVPRGKWRGVWVFESDITELIDIFSCCFHSVFINGKCRYFSFWLQYLFCMHNLVQLHLAPIIATWEWPRGKEFKFDEPKYAYTNKVRQNKDV